MAEIPVVRLSQAARCTTQGDDRLAHHDERFEIASGPGRDSGQVFCYPCGSKKRKTAISTFRRQRTAEANIAARSAGYTSAAAEQGNGWELLIRMRGWLAVVFGAAFLWETQWLISGALGLFALWVFALRSPAPCMHPINPCPNGARGVLRRCANREHRLENWEEFSALVHDRMWPVIWSDWPGRRAVTGFFIAALIAWGSLLGYLATTRAWWVAVLADVGLAVVVIGGVVLWRRRASRQVG